MFTLTTSTGPALYSFSGVLFIHRVSQQNPVNTDIFIIKRRELRLREAPCTVMAPCFSSRREAIASVKRGGQEGAPRSCPICGQAWACGPLALPSQRI